MEDVLKKFTDFESFDVVGNEQVSLDEKITLLVLRGKDFTDANFALVETDYFDKSSSRHNIEDSFAVSFIEWVQPKEKVVISEMNIAEGTQHDAIDVTVTSGQRYTLALVQKQA